MSMKMHYILAAYVLLVGVDSNTIAQETKALGVRADYTGSPSTPDHIMYRRFVMQYESLSDSDGAHAIQHTFDMEHNPEGLARAKNALTVFQNANSTMKNEIREMEDRVLCGEERSQRTRDDTYSAMDSVSDEREAIAMRIYQLGLQELDPETKDSLLSELATMKLSFVGKKRTHKAMYEESGSDVFSVIDNLCTSFRGGTNR